MLQFLAFITVQRLCYPLLGNDTCRHVDISEILTVSIMYNHLLVYTVHVHIQMSVINCCIFPQVKQWPYSPLLQAVNTQIIKTIKNVL
jgi:hypothetical protein